MTRAKPRSQRVTEVVVLTTAMLTFISFWRAAAVVLCDMASTAWYVGGIAEQAVGRAAPWYILAVMLFSSCILAVYVEGSGMFVRGGVYKVVRQSMGTTLAKISVSALMFDYILTGPISSVSAGQYLAGLLNTLFPYLRIGWKLEPNSFAVVFAILVTLYFWRQNILGIEESSEKSLRIIKLAGAMGLVLIGWSGYTLWNRGWEWPSLEPVFSPHALGWLPQNWLEAVGSLGLLVALGHAFLGMSGAESLAQVYREMEAPKLTNLKRAATVIFLFAFCLTTLSSFFGVLLIPDGIRAKYSDNLLAGVAMWLAGPFPARLAFQAFVALVGVLILSGAVNTSVVGANGVLNRLGEDGVLADWFRWLHPKYGTTHRMIHLVVGLQLFTILACRGNVYTLGEAYAFGVIWSFVFMALSMIVLRFKDRSPREWMVPLNIRIGDVHFPIGLCLIALVLLSVAFINLFTKQVATIWGVLFTVGLYLVFWFSERSLRARAVAGEAHVEKLNLRREGELGPALAHVTKPNRVLVAVRDPQNLRHLAKVLGAVDTDTTDVVVVHSKIPRGLRFGGEEEVGMGPDEEVLFTKVISLAEKHGKKVHPVMVMSNDPSYAIAQAAQASKAQEVVIGGSVRLGPEDQLERFVMTWGALGQESAQPVRVRILWDGKELQYDL